MRWHRPVSRVLGRKAERPEQARVLETDDPRDPRPGDGEHQHTFAPVAITEVAHEDRADGAGDVGDGDEQEEIEDAIGEKVLAIPGIELGYCARPGEVEVRIIGNPNWREGSNHVPGGRDVGKEVVETYYAKLRGKDGRSPPEPGHPGGFHCRCLRYSRHRSRPTQSPQSWQASGVACALPASRTYSWKLC